MSSVNWCGRRDLNPHDLRRWNLNPVRLPVPPRPLTAPREHTKRASALAYPFYPRTRQIAKNSPPQQSEGAALAKAREGDDLHISWRAPKATTNRAMSAVVLPGRPSDPADVSGPHGQGPKSARLGVVQGHDGTAGNGRNQCAEDSVVKIERRGKCRKNTKYRQRKQFQDHEPGPFKPAVAGISAKVSIRSCAKPLPAALPGGLTVAGIVKAGPEGPAFPSFVLIILN